MQRKLGVLLAFLLLLPSSAWAMGSGDKYVDAQTGLSYQVLRPAFTTDLLLNSFKLLSCGAGKEQWVAAIYGEDRQIQFLETDAAVQCSNPGLGVQVATATINGFKSKVVVFCDPSKKVEWKNCKSSDMKSLGGYIIWKTKATKNLHATSVEVLGTGISYSDLLKVSRSMKTVQ